MDMICKQVLQHADVAFFFGIIDKQQRIVAMSMQLLVAQLIADGQDPPHTSHFENTVCALMLCAGML